MHFLGAWKEKFFLRIVGCRMPVWRYDTNWITFYEVEWKVNLHEKVTMITRKTRMRVNGGKGGGKRSKQLSPTSAADIPTGCSVTFDRYPLFHIFHCSSIQGHGNGSKKELWMQSNVDLYWWGNLRIVLNYQKCHNHHLLMWGSDWKLYYANLNLCKTNKQKSHWFSLLPIILKLIHALTSTDNQVYS